MDVTARFAEAVQRPEASVPLDDVSFLVAAHAYVDLDVDRWLARLDDIAADCHAPTLDALVDHLFIDMRYTGNRTDYYDPRNSYLNDVIERRTGIPITLSILTMEIGRRLGVPLSGVSMPGHFLLHDRVDQDLFVDAYAGGARLDLGGVRARFHALHGEDTPWDDAFLAPAGAHAIAARLLANLKAIFRTQRDQVNLTWVLRLRGLVPGVPIEERRELASVLAADGKFGQAAGELEDAAETAGEPTAAEFRAAAVRLRARLN